MDNHLRQQIRELIYIELVNGANKDDLYIDIMLHYPVIRFWQLNILFGIVQSSINKLKETK